MPNNCAAVLEAVNWFSTEYFPIPWKYSAVQLGSPSNHRVFSCPVEIFRKSIWVPSSSIYLHSQGFLIINLYDPFQFSTTTTRMFKGD
jgi:hypothetical protein